MHLTPRMLHRRSGVKLDGSDLIPSKSYLGITTAHRYVTIKSMRKISLEGPSRSVRTLAVLWQNDIDKMLSQEGAREHSRRISFKPTWSPIAFALIKEVVVHYPYSQNSNVFYNFNKFNGVLSEPR
jgi:hypothetical protein